MIIFIRFRCLEIYAVLISIVIFCGQSSTQYLSDGYNSFLGFTAERLAQDLQSVSIL